MGRPKQFDERIQLTLVEGTTGRIDALLDGPSIASTSFEPLSKPKSRKGWRHCQSESANHF